MYDFSLLRFLFGASLFYLACCCSFWWGLILNVASIFYLDNRHSIWRVSIHVGASCSVWRSLILFCSHCTTIWRNVIFYFTRRYSIWRNGIFISHVVILFGATLFLFHTSLLNRITTCEIKITFYITQICLKRLHSRL